MKLKLCLLALSSKLLLNVNVSRFYLIKIYLCIFASDLNLKMVTQNGGNQHFSSLPFLSWIFMLSDKWWKKQTCLNKLLSAKKLLTRTNTNMSEIIGEFSTLLGRCATKCVASKCSLGCRTLRWSRLLIMNAIPTNEFVPIAVVVASILMKMSQILAWRIFS